MIPKGLIVSCQSEGDDPFNTPQGVALFAKAAVMGGAIAIRSEGIEKTRTILEEIDVPVIGLIKSYFEDGYVCITRHENDVKELLDIGVVIIAIDGTNRPINGFKSGSDFIKYIKSKYTCIILADISNVSEALDCEKAGADFISTTLNGYTPQTNRFQSKPNFKLVEALIKQMVIPVLAEGRISNVSELKKLKSLGVHGAVVGTAITRPRLITQKFVNSFQ